MNVRPIFLKALLLVVLLAALIGVGGCTAMRQPAELAWQGMHVYDTLQTYDIVNDPCYKEGHPITRAMIGEQPSSGGVVAWGLGSALFHAGVSEVLLRKDMNKTYKFWQAITILDTGMAIHDGISIGVRVGAPNERRIENGCR